MTSIFHKDHPEKPLAIILFLNFTLQFIIKPMAKSTAKLTTKQKHSRPAQKLVK